MKHSILIPTYGKSPYIIKNIYTKSYKDTTWNTNFTSYHFYFTSLQLNNIRIKVIST